MPKRTIKKLPARASRKSAVAHDSYSNPAARLGIGTGNLAGQGRYPLTRITHDYMLMLALYRSHWIVRKVIDAPAEDMLKDFPKLSGNLPPDDIQKFDKAIRDTGTQGQMIRALKWGRLFGGGVGVIVIKGHNDLMEPLRFDDVDLDSYRGLIAFDRWSGVQPDADIVDDLEYPKEFGLPRSYTITTETGTKQVHHTRIVRFTGRELPEWERQTEMYWGLSEVELLFDELQKRDYASWNIVSLLTRAQIMALKDEQLASSMSGIGKTNSAYNMYIERLTAIANTMNNQGLLVLGKDGGLESHQFSFGGLADVYNTYMLDIAGACEIPVSRLYGRTITGLGQSGEGDLQVYYDTIEQKRKRELGPQMDKLLPVVCMSVFGKIPDDFDYTWPPVRTMSNEDRADLADKTTTAVVNAYQGDLITKREARKELKQAADANGLFSNITDEALAATPDEYASESGMGELDLPDDEHKPGTAKDADRPTGEVIDFQGLTIGIENPAGSVRSGKAADGKKWTVTFKHAYGFIDNTVGADGDSVDCFVGPDRGSQKVFVIHQNDLDGNFDEHKVMLGYPSAADAKNAYFDHYDRPEAFFDSMEEMSIGDFRGWLADRISAQVVGQ